MTNPELNARVNVAERPLWNMNGFLALLILLAALAVAIGTVATTLVQGATPTGGAVLFAVLLGLAAAVLASGLTIVEPGTTRVVQFFGRYIGTIRQQGLRMTVPLTAKSLISVRVHNFETAELKVNDAEGNPVNIAAIVVWQVADTAKALFAVADYEQFVRVQSESALRHVAMAHPYDHADDGQLSLRGATDQVAQEIAVQVQDRVGLAEVEIVEARISKLAYAPEIAQAMLQRQQAGAILAARSRIVDGAVGMVQSALERLEGESIVKLDEEHKAAMVSNLLVVLCGEGRPTAVVNAGLRT